MSLTKIPRTLTGTVARFGIGIFGKAKFGVTDGFTKVLRNTESLTKVPRNSQTFGALADFAQADFAQADLQGNNFTKIPRPQ